MNLDEKLELLPNDPGVYLMKDSRAKIIYVGKAKNLRKRVMSYFRKGDPSPKTKALVGEIFDFEVIITLSEVEALLLERTLIKHHAPHYNILLRDDKEFPFVRIDYNEKWPRIKKVRKRHDDGAVYVGPFGNQGQLNITLKTIMNIFPIVRCSEYEFKKATRPCNYYHMKLCLGQCTKEVDRDQYLESVRSVEKLLRGQNSDVKDELKRRMVVCSEKEQFESAAAYRDQLMALEGIGQKQVAVVGSVRDADAVGVYLTDDVAVFHVLFVREFVVIGGDTFMLDKGIDTVDEFLPTFLMQYYEHRYIPEKLIVEMSDEYKKTIAEALKNQANRSVVLNKGQSGEYAQLMKMSFRNAVQAYREATNLSHHKKLS